VVVVRVRPESARSYQRDNRAVTQTLGDMGADVITVETLDMKRVCGREAVLRIAAGCDALVTNLCLSIRVGRGPSLASTILADKVCRLTIVSAVMVALLHKARTGEGQRIEAPMADVTKSFMLVEHGAGAISVPPSGNVGLERVFSPERDPQRTSDSWINILPYSAEAYEAKRWVNRRAHLYGRDEAPELVWNSRSVKLDCITCELG
jgi:crotonobetainyl-CoA:carnitine CoA-transferase CaiB-like acyl-CoA transferase